MFVNTLTTKSRRQLIWNVYTQTYIMFYLIAVSLLFLNHPTPTTWIDNIKKSCPMLDGLDTDPESHNFK